MNIENEKKTDRTIEIQENKILKLHKVIKRLLSQQESIEMIKTLQLIQGYIKARGLETRGPLITLSQPVTVDDESRVDTYVIFQLMQKPHSKLEYPYIYQEEIKVENCLYTRFIASQQYLPIAYSKISVYAYEHYLKLKGDIYTIYLANDENEYTCDIFAEVEK